MTKLQQEGGSATSLLTCLKKTRRLRVLEDGARSIKAIEEISFTSTHFPLPFARQ